ncbi:hypothetical protein K450DRAFT_235823 [Umbelopsis ramanniana AG]|uniref:Uncharacterized protein n=1 Tax=Umbelopsis ramanniana AG TaxID=1314678 RepID=A0AAD5EBP6_UMBRA|nr:uncharacterized protein K450DRAFT_235823 [Umbelopsis ramanniana AG]KAI8580763.1 hypothetical protein K450DRAFT_235823 [Umbelopsis ramanniana AG]
MSTLAHYFVGGVLLSSSTTWLKYFVGYNLSVTDTAISFVSRDIPLWRWTMLLGMLNCVWTLGTLFPSSVEGIGGWTLQAPKFAILAGLVSGIGAKLCSDTGYEDPPSAYTQWSKDVANYYGASLVGAMVTSFVIQKDSNLKLPDQHYQVLPGLFGSLSLIAILGIQAIVFKYLESIKSGRSISPKNKQAIVSYICGVYYVMGLGYSGLLCPSKARNFVNVHNLTRFDASWIASVLGTWAARYIFSNVTNTAGVKRPLFNSGMRLSAALKRPLQNRALIGSTIAGIGWSLEGLSIGSALIISTCRPSLSIVSFCICYVAAYFITDRIQHQRTK